MTRQVAPLYVSLSWLDSRRSPNLQVSPQETRKLIASFAGAPVQIYLQHEKGHAIKRLPAAEVRTPR